MAAVIATVAFSPVNADVVTGAGATLPFPVYSKWADVFGKKEGGFKLNYQSIGSGGGIKQIKEKTVVFGASDKPLKIEDKDGKDSLGKIGLVQFPTVMGGVVPVINISGINPGQLNLSKKVLADIFMGNIVKWNDPAIQAINSGVQLPDSVITVVHRADSSGTTFLFTDYLSKISEDWKKNYGADSAVKWPAGIGAKGNEGVAAQVKQVPNSIGYVEYSYAKENKLAYAKLETESGYFIEPTKSTFQNAAQNAKWDENDGFHIILTNADGKDSWPITGATFILMYETTDSGKDKEAAQVLNFFDWAYGPEGDAIADSLGYIQLPDDLKDKVRSSWKKIKSNSGEPLRK